MGELELLSRLRAQLIEREQRSAYHTQSQEKPHDDDFSWDYFDRNQALRTQFRLTSAMDSVTDAVIILDADCTILYVNRAFERLTGYPGSELSGLFFDEVLASAPKGDGHEHLYRALEQGQSWSGHLAGRTSTGNKYQSECTLSPIYDGRRQVTDYVIVLHDITQKAELEAQLRQAQKVEAVGRLASGVAHDFNNLLTVIGGYADLSLRRLDADQPLTSALQEVQADLEGIGEVVQRAAALTNQLLIFSRKQEPQPKRLNLNNLVHNTEKLLRRLIGEDIVLHTSLDPDLGWIEADPGHIEQVIMNLAVNARDAMPYGGQLVLETANVDEAECEGSTHRGPHVMFSISDTGTGMTEEVRSHIFEPFFTTKEAGKGTGLGLATVMGIVEQCGAQIGVDSRLGAGSKFTICFPRVSDADQDAAGQETSAAYPRGTETILLVEDEEVVRSLACRVLESQGYNVLAAHDPDESLLLTARHTGNIDLLITDVVMPGMGGAELASWIAESRPQTRVLYMSGYTEDAIAHRGITSSGVAFLQKPFTPSALAAKVRSLLDGDAG